MTDFIISETTKSDGNKYMLCNKFVNYANFLKQHLELWMFVPCDEDGNVLEEPERWNDYLEFPESFDGNKEWYEFYAYEQAKERCLFEGFSYHIGLDKNNRDFWYVKNESGFRINDYEFEVIKITIEQIVKYNLELTQTAQKQIGL